MTIQITIEAEHKDYCQIEEICACKAINISQYFMELHKLNMQEAFIPKGSLQGIESMPPGVISFHEKFESLARHDLPPCPDVVLDVNDGGLPYTSTEQDKINVTTIQNQGLPDLSKKKKKK